jgi:hypothetical protein
MRLQLSDVCSEGRVVAGASRYECGINRLRCTAASMMWTIIYSVRHVHLRRGSYLLAPTTIDPSRTNNTASSRFRGCFHCYAFFIGCQNWRVATCSMMAMAV